MVIHLRKPEVLKGLVAKHPEEPFVRVSGFGPAEANLLEEGAEFCGCHADSICVVDIAKDTSS
jgi:hypothetical protein